MESLWVARERLLRRLFDTSTLLSAWTGAHALVDLHVQKTFHKYDSSVLQRVKHSNLMNGLFPSKDEAPFIL